MNIYNVLSFQQAISNDFVVKCKSSDFTQLANPGQYVECRFTENESVIKPFIFSVNDSTNEFELLITAQMMKTLQRKKIPRALIMSNPVGKCFKTKSADHKIILLANEIGLAPIFYLADVLMKQKLQPLVFLSTKKSFPFSPAPSQFVIKNLPVGMLATCPLLEDKKIPARLLSENALPGCYDGSFEQFIVEQNRQNWFDKNTYFFIAGDESLETAVKLFSEKFQFIST